MLNPGLFVSYTVFSPLPCSYPRKETSKHFFPSAEKDSKISLLQYCLEHVPFLLEIYFLGWGIRLVRKVLA